MGQAARPGGALVRPRGAPAGLGGGPALPWRSGAARRGGTGTPKFQARRAGLYTTWPFQV